MKELETILKGAASVRRIGIIKELWPDKEFNVTEIADRIDLSFRSASKHLIKMEKAGYLKSKQNRRWKDYWINPDASKLVKKIIELVKNYPSA